MELHPALIAVLTVVLGAMAGIALLWLYAGLGAWIDDAFESRRWIWFVLLLCITFPASLFAWLIVRIVRQRPSSLTRTS